MQPRYISLLFLFFYLWQIMSFLPPPSFAKLALNPREDPQGLWPDPEIFNISRAAKSRSSAQFARRSANERKSVTRILTHENLLTSVPTQNVDSAELTDIKRILNVLLKKKKKKLLVWNMYWPSNTRPTKINLEYEADVKHDD